MSSRSWVLGGVKVGGMCMRICIYGFFPQFCPRRSRVDSKTLTRNTRLIAEALTRVIYNLTEKVSPRVPRE